VPFQFVRLATHRFSVFPEETVCVQVAVYSCVNCRLRGVHRRRVSSLGVPLPHPGIVGAVRILMGVQCFAVSAAYFSIGERRSTGGSQPLLCAFCEPCNRAMCTFRSSFRSWPRQLCVTLSHNTHAERFDYSIVRPCRCVCLL